jgi:hypothetical protein
MVLLVARILVLVKEYQDTNRDSKNRTGLAKTGKAFFNACPFGPDGESSS